MTTEDLDGALEAVARINVEAGRLLLHLLEGPMSPEDEMTFGSVLAKAGQALKRDGRKRQTHAAQ